MELSAADLIDLYGDRAAIRASVLVSRAAADDDIQRSSYCREMLLFWQSVAERLRRMGYASDCWAVVPQRLPQPTLADALCLARDRDQADVEANSHSVAHGQPMAVVPAVSLGKSPSATPD